jgi:hypothetical protein
VSDWLFRHRHYLWLSVAFVASRVLLYELGLRFELILTWMFLSDPAQLSSELYSTLLYFHAFPPGMNVLTGVGRHRGPPPQGEPAAGPVFGLGGGRVKKQL